ncbi:hypothetical protein VTH06DRAFT_1699 [Thermothelomyces fergusii]
MGREKRHAPGPGAGDHAKERHKRDRRGNLIDWTAPLPPGLVARPEKPRISSKHKVWYELVPNTDKKEKKLEFKVSERPRSLQPLQGTQKTDTDQETHEREPPPGFEFVPIGNPALTKACKELSREQDAMIFIVTLANGLSKRLSSHLNRVGYHFRQTIVEQARASLGEDGLQSVKTAPGLPEPIPERQEDINKQADAAIRDLFPRIPNPDRQAIIEHAFNKSKQVGKDPPVGLAADITLSRRVQLAVLAHIRHNHTRYDQLLKETSYVNARKAVESLCLDILVKWRGDEETGRDQLDEILREIIVISDSESDESDEDEEDDESSDTSSEDESRVNGPGRADRPARETFALRAGHSPASSSTNKTRSEGFRGSHAPQKIKKPTREDKRAAKWAHRGFQRYQAARDEAWNQALERQRRERYGAVPYNGSVEDPPGHAPQLWRDGEPIHSTYRLYGPPLPAVGMSRERESRASEPERAAPLTAYTMSQPVHPWERQRSNRSGPIVGSRVASHEAPVVEPVTYHGQDMDYLVQSIEPAETQVSDPPPPVPVSYRPSVSSSFDDGRAPIRRAVHYPPQDAGVVTEAHGVHPDFAEGFITLSHRSDPGRMRAAPEPPAEPFILLNPQNGSAAGAIAVSTTPRGPSSPHARAWRDHGTSRDVPHPRSGMRPVWIEYDGALLRSESHPIVIPDDPVPSRQPRMEPAYPDMNTRRPSPVIWTHPRHISHGWTNGREGRYVDPDSEERVEAFQNDFGDFVRVSNRFPRQYEPRLALVEETRYYYGQSSAQRRGAPPQPDDDVARYDARQFRRPEHRREHVVERIEGSAPHDEHASFVTHQPQGYQRQERVVGTEYVHSHASVETPTESDGVPYYEAKEPVYRSQSRPATAVPYGSQPYQRRC